MASDGGGKLKLKRPQSASKPYERRKSLYKKVTDTVKDLLSPSWLTDIVSTVKTSPPKPNPIIIEDEDEEEMFMNQPSSSHQMNNYSGPPRIASQLGNRLPAPQPKRTRLPVPSDAPINKPTPSSYHCQSGFGMSQFQPSRYAYGMDRNSVARPPIRRDESASSSQASGSSTLLHAPIDTLQLNDTALQQIREDLNTGANTRSTVTDITYTASSNIEGQSKRPRLWGNEISSRPTRLIEPPVKDRPSFKASLFGSPVVETSLLGEETLNESSFYAGKTTFGGSSALRNRNRLNVTAPYQTALPIRKQIKPKSANSSFSAVTSSSARRILESLERMSTPLSDVKKIPMENPSVSDSLLSFTPSSYRRQSFQPSLLSRRSLEVPSSRSGPPTSQIRTHSIASISRNRQTFTSTPRPSRTSSQTQQHSIIQESAVETMETSKHENISQNTKPKTTVITADTPASWSSSSGKIKRDKSHHYSSKKTDEEEVVEVPSLKSDFTLPVAKLPQIQFTATPIGKVDDLAAKAVEKEASDLPSVKFKFSSPIHEHSKPQTVQSPVGNVQGFVFSSPLKVDDKKVEQTVTATATSSAGMFGFSFASSTPSTAPKPKVNTTFGNGGIGFDFKASPIVSSIENKSTFGTSSFGGTKPAPTLKSGSVMDVLGSGLKTSPNLKQGSVMDVLSKKSISSPASTLKQGSVMDILGKKDTFSVKKTSTTSDDKPTLAALFAKPSGTWTCDTCLIENNPEKTRCAACETPKPSSKPIGRLIASEKSAPSTEKVSLAAMFAKPAGSWSCDICLVENGPDKAKCAACETPKPGSKTSGKSDNSLSALFKKPAGSWDCDTCMVQNTGDLEKCAACETPKPGCKSTFGGSTSSNLPSAGTLTDSGFKIDTSQLKQTSSASGFKFDTTSDYKAPAGGGFNFVSDSKQTETKSSAATGFSFGAKDSTSSAPKQGTGFSFGNPTSSSEQKTSSGFSFGKTQTSDNKISSGTGLSFGNPVKSSDDKTGASNFSFGKTDSKDVKTSSGFSFGAQSNSSNTEVKQSNVGFSFNSTPKTTDNSQMNGMPSMGGFAFGGNSNVIKETNNNDLDKAKSENKGGFSFGQSTNTGNSLGGFSFGAAKTVTTGSNLIDDKSKLPSNFTFGSGAPSANAGGLGVFASSNPAVKLANSFNAASSKRGIEEETEGPAAKKVFAFSSGGSNETTTNTSSPFQFGVTTAAKPAAVVQPEIKSTVPSFSFNPGNQTNNTGFSFGTNSSSSVFGAKPTDKPSDGVFTFGAGSSSTVTPAFGDKSNNSFTTGAPAAFGSNGFGGNGSTSGSSLGSAPAFGASSATPAFGASGQTPSFGSTNTTFGAPATNAGFNFSATPSINFGGGTGASTFQFSAKPNESVSATTAQTPSTGFVFGAQTAPVPTPAFSAPSFATTGSTPGFNIGSTTDSTRKIKRAVRRKK